MSMLVATVLAVLRAMTLEPERLARAWARVMPAVTLVPAFGLRALPVQVRGVFALMLALVVAPSLPHAPLQGGASAPWPMLLVGELVRGLPVALAAALPLWAATMTGSVLDQARGQNELSAMPLTEGRSTAFGHLYSLLGASLFLASHGASRVADALLVPTVSVSPFLAARDALLGGVNLAIALGAPIIVTQIVMETTAAMVTRAASPSNVQTLVAPFRSVVILLVAAITLERLASLFAIIGLR